MTPAPSITLHNAQRKLRVDSKRLRQFSARALPLCLKSESPANDNLSALQEVNIVLVSDRRMAALHKQFMNIDGPTDVLTFQHGEIFISAETAQQNAAEFATSIEEEISLYIVHGLLHLRGLDDIAPRDARRMNSMQQRIFAAAFSA